MENQTKEEREVANPDLYEEWRNNAHFSEQHHMMQTQKQQQQEYDQAKEKFYHWTTKDNEMNSEKRQKLLEENSVFNVKKQFLPEANESDKPVHHYDDNIDFMTSNAFYHSLTKNSVETQNQNPSLSTTLQGLDPEVFEVTAKKQDPIWKTNTYKDPQFRKDLNTTSKNQDFGFNEEMASKLHTNKFNKRVTAISEYSNASHNGIVFKNPRFTSC